MPHFKPGNRLFVSFLNFFSGNRVCFFFLLLFPLAGFSQKPVVIVIGVDGMSPDGIENAITPVMDSLKRVGAWTYEARAVLPTSSSPNWASMICGAKPELHGIFHNGWKLSELEEKYLMENDANTGQSARKRQDPCYGKQYRFSTIFRLLHEQKPKARIGVFHDWFSFGRLIEPGVCGTKRNTWGIGPTSTDAITYIRIRKPDFVFLHLDKVDHVGHAKGHGTPAYFEAVSQVDKQIGRIVRAAMKGPRAQETYFLITSDHGGKGKGHGGDSPEEVNIPWIIAGPRIRPGKQITARVETYDTAATIAFIFGLKQPDCWQGRKVGSAFKKEIE